MANTIYKTVEGKKIMNHHYENYLSRIGKDIERIYVDTSFGKTHMLMIGPKDGKPIFIFQGGNCINPMTLSWFKPLMDRYRIYAPDTIGHPGYSDENRISAKDHSFAQWIEELMEYFNINSSAFIGPSYGAGIILRLASVNPKKIDCAILLSPAGIRVGSKVKMMKDILLPLVLYKATTKETYINKITRVMSVNSMKEVDKQIIADIFKHTKLEQNMPKLTQKQELLNYNAPTLVIAGKQDIFFPENVIKKAAKEIIRNLKFKTYDMGHLPSEKYLLNINEEIKEFLLSNY